MIKIKQNYDSISEKKFHIQLELGMLAALSKLNYMYHLNTVQSVFLVLES